MVDRVVLGDLVRRSEQGLQASIGKGLADLIDRGPVPTIAHRIMDQADQHHFWIAFPFDQDLSDFQQMGQIGQAVIAALVVVCMERNFKDRAKQRRTLILLLNIELQIAPTLL